MKKKNVLHVISFSIIGMFLFVIVQTVLVPDDQSYLVRRAMYSLDILEDDALEVLFLGASHMGCGITPMKIYDDTGIVSYNMGTQAQQIDESYYLLEEVFERQSPSVVVLDAGVLFTDMGERSVYRRFLIDSTPFGRLKLNLAEQYAKSDESDGFMSAIIPMLTYHTRWDSLSVGDFIYDKMAFTYMLGYSITPIVSSSGVTQEMVDVEANTINARNIGYSKTMVEGELIETSIDEEVYAPDIADVNLKYLLEMQRLCEEMGTSLLLTKIPTGISAVDYSGAWTQIKSEQVREVADQYGIDFYDLTYDSDLQMDWINDTPDGGMHLNISGAEKTTDCILEYLQQNYSLQSVSSSHYEEALNKYKTIRENISLQMENEFEAYIEQITATEDIIVVLVASHEWTAGLDEDDYSRLQGLGLKLITDAQYGDAYVAVVRNGIVEYEGVSDRKIQYEYEEDKLSIEVCSAGYYYHGAGTSVKINGNECGTNCMGLNMVVIDTEMQNIRDSVTFNTSVAEKPGWHYYAVCEQ